MVDLDHRVRLATFEFLSRQRHPMLMHRLQGFHGSRLTYASAGHNPPLIAGRTGVRRLERGGLILGAFPDAQFEEETVSLDPGDVLVVFSDGITEAPNRDRAELYRAICHDDGDLTPDDLPRARALLAEIRDRVKRRALD